MDRTILNHKNALKDALIVEESRVEAIADAMVCQGFDLDGLTKEHILEMFKDFDSYV